MRIRFTAPRFSYMPVCRRPDSCRYRQKRLPTLSRLSVSAEVSVDVGGGCRCWQKRLPTLGGVVSVGGGRGRPGFGRWRVGDAGELSGFPGSRLFSRIRRGSLRESDGLADLSQRERWKSAVHENRP
ncbi:hypothetical protein BTHE_1038 [Bifidobacterium thermophilum]|nr:hypothetical protein BTHE_1038 [Bifidobacterium thermophilum]